MRRAPAVITLVVLAPAIAELSIGDLPFDLNGLVGTEFQVVNHPIWNLALPILFTDPVFPAQRRRPLLGRAGLVVTSLVYLLGVGLTALSRLTIDPGHAAPPAALGGVLLVAVVLGIVALCVLPRTGGTAAGGGAAPSPCVLTAVGLVGGSPAWDSSTCQGTRTSRSCGRRSSRCRSPARSPSPWRACCSSGGGPGGTAGTTRMRSAWRGPRRGPCAHRRAVPAEDVAGPRRHGHRPARRRRVAPAARGAGADALRDGRVRRTIGR
jgi:hypothetical protein